MTDIVEIEHLRGENTGLRAALNWKCAEIERLRDPFRAVDAQDWEFVMGALPDGGRGRFWKAVLGEMRAALEQGASVSKTEWPLRQQETRESDPRPSEDIVRTMRSEDWPDRQS